MRLSDINRTATIFTELDKPNRLLATWTGADASLMQTIIEQHGKQDRLLGSSTLVQQIVSGQFQPAGLSGLSIQPSALHSMIEQVASSKPLNFGLNAAFLNGVADAQATPPDLYPSLLGTFRFQHADLLTIAATTGSSRLKLRQDLFQGITAQLSSIGALGDWRSIVSPGFTKALSGYEDGLLARYAAGVVAEAEAVADSAPEFDLEDDAEQAIWLGAESWSALVHDLVTTLKAVELITAGMVGAKEGLDAPIPTGVMILIYMAIASAEFAAHLAAPAAERLDRDADQD